MVPLAQLAMNRLSTLASHLGGSSVSAHQCAAGELGVTTVLFQGDSITDAGRGREATEPNMALGTGYAQMTSAILLSERPGEDLKIYNRGASLKPRAARAPRRHSASVSATAAQTLSLHCAAACRRRGRPHREHIRPHGGRWLRAQT